MVWAVLEESNVASRNRKRLRVKSIAPPLPFSATATLPISPPLSPSRDWQRMISISDERGGEFKAIGRLSDIVYWREECSPQHQPCADELDFGKFMALLKADCGFDSDIHCVAWESDGRRSSIDNGRQWKAVVAHFLTNELQFNFIVCARRCL